MDAPLYNSEILRLTTAIPFQERLSSPQASVERRSPICGSRVTVELDLDDGGRVSAVGLVARACALGQASTALLGQGIIGKTPEELAAARDTLTAWLAGQGAVPEWRGLDLFTPALPHSARHPSIRLAWEAAAEAAAYARDCSSESAAA